MAVTYLGQASADIKIDSVISSKICKRNSALAQASPPGSIFDGFNYKHLSIRFVV